MTLSVSRRLEFSEIPIIDLAASDAVGAIRTACTGVGLLYVVNHDVTASAVTELVEPWPRSISIANIP